MLLTALAIFDHDMLADAFSELAEATRQALPVFTKKGIEMEMPSRMVITGSGVLRFTAREAALKIMELAAGQIPSIWDSSLGFRHGPKSFVSHYTHVLILKSADPCRAVGSSGCLGWRHASYYMSGHRNNSVPSFGAKCRQSVRGAGHLE